MNAKEEKRVTSLIGNRKVYEMTEEEKAQPITKEMGRMCRHRLEKRWYRRLVEINILLIVIVLGVVIYNFGQYKELGRQYMEQVKEEAEQTTDQSKSTKKDSSSVADKKDKLTKDDIPFAIQMLGYGILILVIGYIGLYFYFAYYRSMSLRITEKNFPEVYRIIETYSKRLGIKVPRAYVMQSNGVLNAFSSFVLRKQWICIHSELFEVAYREYKDMDALSFIIAHEMAHIYYGHATLHYNLPIWFSERIPVIGAIASRTREYSCDRLAQRLTGVDGIDAMLTLVVDRHLYKMVDKEDYLNEMSQQRGFFIWLVNMIADHPVMCKRVIALHEGRGSGKLY